MRNWRQEIASFLLDLAGPLVVLLFFLLIAGAAFLGTRLALTVSP